MKTFAIERIENLKPQRQKFVYPKEFDVQQYFENCFGIVGANGEEPQIVALSFDPNEADYLKSLPLHHSQIVTMENENEFIIQLKICITYDFIKEILSYVERVKVIQPNSLAETIAEQASILGSYYKTK